MRITTHLSGKIDPSTEEMDNLDSLRRLFINFESKHGHFPPIGAHFIVKMKTGSKVFIYDKIAISNEITAIYFKPAKTII